MTYLKLREVVQFEMPCPTGRHRHTTSRRGRQGERCVSLPSEQPEVIQAIESTGRFLLKTPGGRGSGGAQAPRLFGTPPRGGGQAGTNRIFFYTSVCIKTVKKLSGWARHMGIWAPGGPKIKKKPGRGRSFSQFPTAPPPSHSERYTTPFAMQRCP